MIIRHHHPHSRIVRTALEQTHHCIPMVMGLSLPEGSTGHASYQKYRACPVASGRSSFRVFRLPGHDLRPWEYPADRPGHAVGPHPEPGGHLPPPARGRAAVTIPASIWRPCAVRCRAVSLPCHKVPPDSLGKAGPSGDGTHKVGLTRMQYDVIRRNTPRYDLGKPSITLQHVLQHVHRGMMYPAEFLYYRRL